MENTDLKGIYKFAGFRLDPQKKRLLQGETIISLTPKEYEILLLLITKAGQIVEKDELLEKIWENTFVEEGTLTRNISWLRKKLAGQVGEDIKIIETVPKVGYRLLPEVSINEFPNDTKTIEKSENGNLKILPASESGKTFSSAIESPQTLKIEKTEKRISKVWAISAVAAFLAIAAGGLIAYRANFAKSPKIILTKNVVPLSGLPGRETSPAFSPDGRQIVYSWDGGAEGGNFDIYIKLIGAGEPVRLTTNQADEINPVFSPDGSSIAFLRVFPTHNEIIKITALGGAEQRISEQASYASISFSPDGKSLAVAELDSSKNEAGIYSLDLQNGAKKRLTAPPASAVDHTPRFSPDGKSLAFVRHFATFRREIYIVPIGGGEARQLTADDTRIYGLAWSSDSKNLFFTSYRKTNQLGLWEIPANGATESQMVPTGSKNLDGVALSPDGKTIAFTEETADENIWEINERGEIKKPLIRSVRADHSQQFSPDGKQIVFASDRTGEYEIWVADADGKNQRRLTFSNGSAGSPRFSPDGKFVAYDVQTAGISDVYLISVNGGEPRRLTNDDKNNFLPAWSADGQTIFFLSNRSGSNQIWKMPANGVGEPMQLTQQGAFEIFAAPDNKHLIYSKGGGKSGLWQIGVDGGEEKPFSELAEAGGWRSWTIAANGVYYTAPAAQPPYKIKFFDFASRQTRVVASVEKPPLNYYANLSVAPDGEKILYAGRDQSSNTIFLAELGASD